jgi:hypothetical protein
MCAWGIDEDGRRELASVRLGVRESKEDWLELGRVSSLVDSPLHAWSSPTERPG